MDSGRMPACDTDSLGGEIIASALDCSSRDDNRQYAYSMQPRIQGNRCGHDKDHFKAPRFHAKDKRRPHSIEEAKRRIAKAVHEIYSFPEFAGIFYHTVEEKKSGRRRRSERIEAAVWLALTTCLQYTNLHKMAFGFYDNRNEFHYYDYRYIENQTNMNPARVKRAMQVLQEEGILKTTTLREQNNDGSWRTTQVRIELTDKIFTMLGLTDEFLTDRETISIKFHEKQQRLDRNRSKREIYRKPTFNKSKPGKTHQNNPSLSLQAQSLVKRVPAGGKGKGVEIRDKIQALVSQGMPIKEAIEIVKKQYPPSH